MRVPVLAYAAAAVPHTLGGAGVRFGENASPRWPRRPTRSPPTRRFGRPCWRGRTGACATSRRSACSARCARTWSRCERRASRDRLRRPALRRGHHGRLRVAGASGRRAAGRRVPHHGVHELRPRLRDLAQRAAGGARAARGSGRAPLPVGERARPGVVQRLRGAAIRAGSGRGGRPGTGTGTGSGRATGTATRTRTGRGTGVRQRTERRRGGQTRSRADELEFLRRQGPEVPRLVEALRAGKDRFAASCSSPTSTTRPTGASRRCPSARPSCPPPTTSRRFASRFHRLPLLTPCERCSVHTGCFNALVSIGSFRKRLPVAAKIALVTAGTMAEVPASPIPPGGSKLWTMWTSMAGASFMRRIW